MKNNVNITSSAGGLNHELLTQKEGEKSVYTLKSDVDLLEGIKGFIDFASGKIKGVTLDIGFTKIVVDGQELKTPEEVYSLFSDIGKKYFESSEFLSKSKEIQDIIRSKWIDFFKDHSLSLKEIRQKNIEFISKLSEVKNYKDLMLLLMAHQDDFNNRIFESSKDYMWKIYDQLKILGYAPDKALDHIYNHDSEKSYADWIVNRFMGYIDRYNAIPRDLLNHHLLRWEMQFGSRAQFDAKKIEEIKVDLNKNDDKK